MKLVVGKMFQWVKALSTQPGILSSFHRTYRTGEKHPTSCPVVYARVHMCACTYTQINVKNC